MAQSRIGSTAERRAAAEQAIAVNLELEPGLDVPVILLIGKLVGRLRRVDRDSGGVMSQQHGGKAERFETGRRILPGVDRKSAVEADARQPIILARFKSKMVGRRLLQPAVAECSTQFGQFVRTDPNQPTFGPPRPEQVEE